MNREGTQVARCTVERFMKRMGSHGVRRGKVIRTTVPDKVAPCPLDRVNRQFKAELIHRRAPWKTKEALELATLEWAAWFNHHRLLSSIGYSPPAEAEVNCYRQLAGKNETGVST